MHLEFEITYTNFEAIELLDSELETLGNIEVDKFEQNGFDGLDILYLFITIAGAASIKCLTKIIIKLIERNDVKSFKYKNIEIKGYSKREVEDLLKKASTLLASDSTKK